MGKYLCQTASWQAFLQQVVTLAGKGYIFYKVVQANDSTTVKKWKMIDSKIIRRFKLEGKNKDFRYQNKKKGYANYQYIRYHNMAIILRTDGLKGDNYTTDKFIAIDEKPIEVDFGHILSFRIGRYYPKDNYSVFLAKGSFKETKAKFAKLVRHNKIDEVKFYFQILNNLPAYAGIIKQKKQLYKAIRTEAKRGTTYINPATLEIKTFRKIYNIHSKPTETFGDEEFYPKRTQPHLCMSWTHFLRRVINYLEMNYHEYKIVMAQKGKEDDPKSWKETDDNILKKFPTNLMLYQIERNKKEGRANYSYFRFKRFGIVLRTLGSVDIEHANDRFSDINKRPLTINFIFKSIIFEVTLLKSVVTVAIDEESFFRIKKQIKEYRNSGNDFELYKLKELLNELPKISKIVEQQSKLLYFIERVL